MPLPPSPPSASLATVQPKACSGAQRAQSAATRCAGLPVRNAGTLGGNVANG